MGVFYFHSHERKNDNIEKDYFLTFGTDLNC